MKIFNYKNILVLGCSKKFKKYICNNFNFETINIIPWRNTKISLDKNEKKADAIIICGYDYSSSKYFYNNYYNTNITRPFSIVKKFYKSRSTILYINTTTNKNYTFSRYYYAKHKLNEKLRKSFKNVISVELPTIVNRGNIDIFGFEFTKIIFKILIFLKVIKCIEYKSMSFKINNNLKNNIQSKFIKIKGKYLKYPRNLFLDRILRLI